MKQKKNIIIFKAKGPLNNTYLNDKLKTLNYLVKSYPILKIKKIYYKKIKTTPNDKILTTSFYGIYFLSKLTKNRNFYLYALGRSSSLLAKNLGFKNIIECSGDSASIINNFISKNKFYKVNKGNIIYAGAKEISSNLPERLNELGYNVKRYKLYSSESINNFNSLFTICSQNPIILNRSIKDNIILNKKFDKKYFNYVLKIVELNKILTKERNINSKISPDTLNFSGGEKQRISIARALYHIKPILIMDEATNGLDEKSELKILKEILKKYKRTTVIFISHNQSLKSNFTKKLILN